MPALNFTTILQQERSLLDEASKKLAVFDKEVEAAQDQLGEVVYASLVAALDAANKSFEEISTIAQSITAASAQGRVAVELLPPTMQAHANAFQGNGTTAPALNQIIFSLRLCAQRPSDVWRGEIRKQAGALLERLHGALSQGTDPRAVAQMAELYTSAFCWFELAWFDNDGRGVTDPAQPKSLFSQLFSLQGALLVAGLATAGYFGGQYVVPFVADKVGSVFGLGGRTKNKEIDDGEDEDEDEGDDAEDEGEEETTFVLEDADMPMLQIEA